MENKFSLSSENWKSNTDFNESESSFTIARVSTVNRDSYKIITANGEVRAEATGKLLFSADDPEEFPATGDYVYADIYDDFALVHEVLPRFSLLKRKASGKKIDYQLIAANLDVIFIMQSLNQDFNLNRIERYMVMANEAEIKPVILLSKSDLVSTEEMTELKQQLSERNKDVEILTFSNVEDSFTVVEDYLEPGKTYALVGSSGVGKTTLLNNLLGEKLYDTKDIREKDDKGKHATTSRNLITLDNGAVVIDTPGMRELGNISLSQGLELTYDEIYELSKNCKYADCTHTKESGCAVLEALENCQIDESRYNNYIKMLKESAHYEMSYQEKRKKDKGFGKMVKEIKKIKKHQKDR